MTIATTYGLCPRERGSMNAGELRNAKNPRWFGNSLSSRTAKPRSRFADTVRREGPGEGYEDSCAHVYKNVSLQIWTQTNAHRFPPSLGDCCCCSKLQHIWQALCWVFQFYDKPLVTNSSKACAEDTRLIQSLVKRKELCFEILDLFESRSIFSWTHWHYFSGKKPYPVSDGCKFIFNTVHTNGLVGFMQKFQLPLKEFCLESNSTKQSSCRKALLSLQNYFLSNLQGKKTDYKANWCFCCKCIQILAKVFLCQHQAETSAGSENTFLIVNLLPLLLGKILLDNKLSEPGRGLHNYPLHTMETSLSNTVLNCQESKLGDN